MSAEDLLKAENLPGALAALEDDVRRHPDVARFRVFLFQLLCVMGQWDRAVRQLQVATELSPDARMMAQTYREAIICEVYREKVFAGQKTPLIFGEPADWIARLAEALKLLADGHLDSSSEMRAGAFEAAPITAGKINDHDFGWIADADTRLGPILEAIVNGRYYWVPFAALAEVTIDEPSDLRDVVWMPAKIRLKNAGETVALIPTRYAGTLESGDGSQILSRETSWRDLGEETFVGIGQRILSTDVEDTALMDVRSITLTETAQ